MSDEHPPHGDFDRERILEPLWAVDSPAFPITPQVKAVFAEMDRLAAENGRLQKYKEFAKRIQINLDCPHTKMGDRELRIMLEMLENA